MLHRKPVVYVAVAQPTWLTSPVPPLWRPCGAGCKRGSISDLLTLPMPLQHMLHGKPMYVALAQRQEDRRAQLEQQYAQRMMPHMMGGPMGAMGPPMGPGMYGPGPQMPPYIQGPGRWVAPSTQGLRVRAWGTGRSGMHARWMHRQIWCSKLATSVKAAPENPEAAC